MYAMIATVLMVEILQTVDAAPPCLCMDQGRLCLRRCITDKCANTCHLTKMRCYRNCARNKKDATMFDALADEDMSDYLF